MKKHEFTPIGLVSEVQLTYRTTQKQSERIKISSSRDSYAVLKPYFESAGIEHHESVFLLCMDKGNKVLAIYQVSSGGLAGTVVDPKMIFQAAILTNSSSIILAHNHPSGNMKASPSDVELTKRIVEAAKTLEMLLLDHLLLSPEEGKYLSFADEGLI